MSAKTDLIAEVKNYMVANDLTMFRLDWRKLRDVQFANWDEDTYAYGKPYDVEILKGELRFTLFDEYTRDFFTNLKPEYLDYKDWEAIFEQLKKVGD